MQTLTKKQKILDTNTGVLIQQKKYNTVREKGSYDKEIDTGKEIAFEGEFNDAMDYLFSKKRKNAPQIA